MKIIKLTFAATAALAVTLLFQIPITMGGGSTLGRYSFKNWHVHDGGTGTTDASGLTHRGVGFFPKIFTGGDVAAYKSDPSLWAYCPNATDKTLLHPDGALPGENLRDGVCINALYIIHLKSKRRHPLRRLVKRQNVTGLNFFLVEFLLPAEILFSGRVRS